MTGRFINRLVILAKSRLSGLLNNGVGTGFLQALPFWIASALTGLVAVGYTHLFGYAETVFELIREWKEYSVFIITPVFFLIAWWVVVKFSPNAKGSGIPQLMAAIELSAPRHDKKIDMLLSFRIMVTKIVSSVLMVLGGGAIGREGPTIQIAGSIFRMINRWIPESWPKLSHQSFLLTGGAAGLAAAFNTPLGGMVFAMEELAKVHLRYFRTALFAAVIIAGLTAQALLGPYLFLGYPDVRNLPFIVFFGVGATAILAGISGTLMCKAILAVMKWKRNFSRAQTIVFILAAGLAIAVIAFFLNDNVFGSGKELMNQTLFTSKKSLTWDTVLLRMLGPVICFNTGAAGGVFAPSLAAGASLGAFISGFFEMNGAAANIIILSGMVGFLTGVTRTPFTSAILVLEMTDRHSVIFHLMLAAFISNSAAMLISKRSFYDYLKESYLEDVSKERKPG